VLIASWQCACYANVMKGCWFLELGSSVRDSLRSRASVEFLVNENHGLSQRTITDITDSVFTSLLLASQTVTDRHGL